MPRAGRSTNPFAKLAPKPKIVDLLKLITPNQKATFRNVSRSLKRMAGVHATLNYYGKEWGWALRYQRGDATLCTLHFLPAKLDATITVSTKLEDWARGPNHLSPATKRSLHSLRRRLHTKMIRLPLGSPLKAKDLVNMVRFKVQCRNGFARRRPAHAERIAGARSSTSS